MRSLSLALALTLLVACGNEVDRPSAAAPCDPATMKCVYMPPETGGGPVGGGEGGDSSSDMTADWSGQVLVFRDDYFDTGTVFAGTAEVSATGLSGARVSGGYDGTSFQLRDVLKSASNWFLVEPAQSQGVLPTLTVIDTRAGMATALQAGLARQLDIDAIFQLSLSGEAAPGRAQVVLRVVDPQNRAVPGVRAQFSAEVVAYRLQTAWDPTEGAVTDDSGMIFFGNVPASQTLSIASAQLSGSANARVEIRTLAGAVTVATAVVAAP